MKNAAPVRSLAQLLVEQPAATPACLVEPSLLPPQGILFVGGEPKVGKSLLVANLALPLAAGVDRLGFPIPAPRRVLVCQFELPAAQFVSRSTVMRRALGAAAGERLLVDTRASGHLLSAAQGLGHFFEAAKAAAAEVIVLDPLYSAHDQDENDTRAMASLCQSLLRLRDASRAALVVVHPVRKSTGRHEIGSAFRGSSVLHAVGDSYVLLTRPSPQLATVELRFQFRYAAAQSPRLLELNPNTLWFSAAASPNATPAAPRRKVAREDVTQAFAQAGNPARYSALRGHIMQRTECVPNVRRRWPSPKLANRAGSSSPTASTGCRCKPGWPASIVRTGSRPGGCPGPMRRSRLRRNRLALPRSPYGRGRAYRFRTEKTKKPAFLW